MSDLISREQALNVVLDAVGELVEKAFYGAMSIPELRETIKKSIADVPTAYDPKKVVEQLEAGSSLARPAGWSKAYEIITLENAIEIVRNGGKE